MDNKIFTVDDLHRAAKAMRDARFSESPQLTLGELIDALKEIPTKWGSDKQDVTVEFDFEYAVPTGLDSWRGSYSELAINFDFLGYEKFDEKTTDMKLKDFIKMLEGAVGKTYTGWKGGDFTMSRETPIWVANNGNIGNTGVIGVMNQGYSATILTSYCEY